MFKLLQNNLLLKYLHDLYFSPKFIQVMKPIIIRWAGHVAFMGKRRCAYRVLVVRP
jgi:hypothetical protein